MSVLKVWQTTAAAFVTLVFWILVLALPSSAGSWPSWIQIALSVVGFAAVVLGPWVVYRGFKAAGDQKGELVAGGAILVLIGVVLFVIAALSTQNLNLTDGRRFAIGVGSAALAGFVYAVTRFDTLRAAASVPVVVLLIGVVAWPGANTLIMEDVRKEVITWMGVVLAASGVSEAAKQIGESNAKAKGQAGSIEEIGSKGDLG